MTKVDDQQAQIYVQGQTAVIPFTLASWAIPRELMAQTAKVTSLKQVLTADDIVIVQRPVEAPDLTTDGVVFASDVLPWATPFG